MDNPSVTGGNYATWNFAHGRSITIEHNMAPGLAISRPTEIYGEAIIIKPSPPRDRTLLPYAIQDAEIWNDYKENSFEGGHILALSLGGPDHSMNIVPMNKGANCGSGVWGQIEREIRARAKQAINGRVNIELTLGYTDMIDPHVPSRVRGSIGTQRIDLGIRPPTDRTNIVGREIRRLFDDIILFASGLGVVATSDTPHAPLDVIDRNLVAAQLLRDRIRQIPLLANYPLKGVKKGNSTVKPMPVQRLLMMLHNRYKNDGLLMAEDPLNLGFMLNEWRVQADHIRPYSKNGTRHYRNLRLLHHRTNNKRGAGATGGGGKIKRVRRAPDRYSPY